VKTGNAAGHRRRELVAFAAALSLIAATVVAMVFWPSATPARKFVSGAELAKILIQRATENNGVAGVSGLGGKLCVHPEGIFFRSYPNFLFPGFSVSYQETDESSGFWFAIIGFDATRSVEIYGIPRTVLAWDAPQNVPVSTLITCPAALVISKDGGTVFLLHGQKRVPAIESMTNQ
jgi:hypothetical protein